MKPGRDSKDSKRLGTSWNYGSIENSNNPKKSVDVQNVVAAQIRQEKSAWLPLQQSVPDTNMTTWDWARLTYSMKAAFLQNILVHFGAILFLAFIRLVEFLWPILTKRCRAYCPKIIRHWCSCAKDNGRLTWLKLLSRTAAWFESAVQPLSLPISIWINIGDCPFHVPPLFL